MGAAEFIVDDFAGSVPAKTDLIDSLVAEYRQAESRIHEVCALMLGDNKSTLRYFLEGNGGQHGVRLSHTTTNRLFESEGAIAALNAHYWSRALQLTDVLEIMPQRRRDDWFEQISEHKTPAFDEASARSTLASLLASRETFFAEKVDGIFCGLSRSHVTNRPEGFSKRMIIEGALDRFGDTNISVSGRVDDLRYVIAKFRGEAPGKWNATSSAFHIAKQQMGRWLVLDGGALRLRLFNVGTVHLEVHPDIAWRLNAILAHLYPMAIPAALRTRPRKVKIKEFDLRVCEIPYGVRASLDEVFRGMITPMKYRLPLNRSVEAIDILRWLGAAVDEWFDTVEFEYDASEALKMVICSGCLPEQTSHQFYETREVLARKLVDLADIDDEHICLEPEAGQGGIAKYMPRERTQCVEINPLFAKVLEGRRLRTLRADFLEYASTTAERFDRVCMNPPFEGGRWKAHLQAAASLLQPNGLVAAILPSSARGSDPLPGMRCEWHGPFTNEFTDTAVSVVILIARK